MKFSFVIPVYNAENYISRCIDSLLQQDIDDYEIICIDDGSKDSSLSILNEYKSHFPEKFNIISQENHGIGPARNAAFKTVNGDYTWFIDNDDCIRPNCLGSLTKELAFVKADIVNITYKESFFNDNPFNTEKAYTEGGYTHLTKISQDYAMCFYTDAPWSKIYRTEFLRANNLFFSDIFGEDTVTTFDLYSKTTNIFMVDKPLYAWFQRRDSFCHSIISEKHFKTFPLLLELLKKQSENCDARLKPYYEYLILRKEFDFYPRFMEGQVTGTLKTYRDECIRSSKKIISDIPINIFFEMYKSNLESKNKEIQAAKEKIQAYYENSKSWKITKPLRACMKLLNKGM